MVDFYKKLREFQRLGSSSEKKEKKTKAEQVSISEDTGKEELSLAKERSSVKDAEALYRSILDFVKDIMDKVRRGKEDKISASALIKNTEKFCTSLEGLESPEDLIWLVSKNDEYKENYMYMHSVNVCLLSLYLAHKLRFPDDKKCIVATAGLFHDIGMFKIPQEIWNNPEKLSPESYEKIKKHPLYGEGILVGIKGLAEVIPLVVSQHQEKVDGSGYLGGLTKDQIHHLARLISVVDRYEAATHTRLWRKKVLPDVALQRILDNESHLFDPYYLKALLKYISVFPIGSWVKISSGDMGMVLKTNENMPMRPVVKVLYNSEGQALAEEKVLDLSKQMLLHAEHCVEIDSVIRK